MEEDDRKDEIDPDAALVITPLGRYLLKAMQEGRTEDLNRLAPGAPKPATKRRPLKRRR